MQAKHSMLVGVSGGGKTTLMREIHENFDGVSIFVNHGGEKSWESNIAGYRAKGQKALATAVGKYDTWSDVKINLRGDDPLELVSMAVSFGIDVWDTAGVPVQILLDECHHVIGENSGTARDNAGMWILAEGRDKGIKGVFATQNHQKLDYDDLLNIPYWAFVGKPAAMQEGVFRYWGIDAEDLPSEQYEYVVKDRSMETLYRSETKEEYA